MRTILPFLSCLLFFSVAYAGNSGISGVVHDDSGKPLFGVTVVLKDSIHAIKTAKTGADGRFSFKGLDNRSYTVDYEAAGFESFRFLAVTPQAGEQLEADAMLKKEGAWGKDIWMQLFWRILTTNQTFTSTTVVAGSSTTGSSSAPRSMHIPSGGTVASPSVTADRPSLAPPMPPPKAPEEKSEPAPIRSKELAYKAEKPAAGLKRSKGDAAGSPALVDGYAAAAVIAPAATLAPRAGMLTSGEVNDFSKWQLWDDISMSELKAYRNTWPFMPEERYTVIVKSETGSPICNAAVKLMVNGSDQVSWEAVTDNTGKAELWHHYFKGIGAREPLSATVSYGGKDYRIKRLTEFHEGINIFETHAPCQQASKVDIAFIVDATGSMQDEINYLKAELDDILNKVKDSLPQLKINTGAAFYRDLHDAYVVRIADLTADFSATHAFIKANNADGGDDFPEAVDVALQQSLDQFHWRNDAIARIAFLVLDAPPHNDSATVGRVQRLTYQYAQRGIRLVPVVCSGSDKSTEYLLRSMALATNGTYLFLTDHSGIGESHITPTTDKYDVTYLNELIYRTIYQCSYMPVCDQNKLLARTDTAAVKHDLTADTSGKITSSIQWKFYPNPTRDLLNIDYSNTSGFLLVCDISGKILFRVETSKSGHSIVDMSNYPSGLYMIRYTLGADQWLDGKFIVAH